MFSSLGHNTQHQPKGEKVYFDSQFAVSWPQCRRQHGTAVWWWTAADVRAAGEWRELRGTREGDKASQATPPTNHLFSPDPVSQQEASKREVTALQR